MGASPENKRGIIVTDHGPVEAILNADMTAWICPGCGAYPLIAEMTEAVWFLICETDDCENHITPNNYQELRNGIL